MMTSIFKLAKTCMLLASGAFVQLASASSSISPLDARIEYKLNRKSTIALDCLNRTCIVEGRLAGKRLRFADDEFSPGRAVQPFIFNVFLDPVPENWDSISFSANVSVDCDTPSRGDLCFSEFLIYEGKIISGAFTRKQMRERDRKAWPTPNAEVGLGDSD